MVAESTSPAGVALADDVSKLESEQGLKAAESLSAGSSTWLDAFVRLWSASPASNASRVRMRRSLTQREACLATTFSRRRDVAPSRHGARARA